MRQQRRRRTQRLTRSLVDRTFGGVCGGLGTYLGINPWWVRGAFMALIVFTLGTGLLIYAILWLAIPEQRLSDLQGENNPFADNKAVRRVRPETLMTIGSGVILTGVAVLALNLGLLENVDSGTFLPFVVILLGITLFAQQLRRSAS